MFSLEKLQVYERALASVAGLARLSANWDKRHAVMDQLLRASENGTQCGIFLLKLVQVFILDRMRSLFVVFCIGAACPQVAAQAGTLAQFRTPLGDLEVELFDSDKPVTVQNFVRYVQSGLYRDCIMHRWVPGFVIQGGGYSITNRLTTNANFAPIPTFPAIVNEYSVGPTFSNSYGTIAMARVEHATNSATSQWFFNLADNTGLDTVDGGFTVFGRVVRGTNVLNRFNLTSTNNGIYVTPDNLPVLSYNPTFADLVYVDISLLSVQITREASGGRIIQWQSVSNKVNRVEFTTRFPPSWQELSSTNGTGQTMQVTVAPSPAEPTRFYRVRVEY